MTSRQARRGSLFLIAVFCFAGAAGAAESDSELPLELQPYQVRVRVGFAHHPQLTAEFRSRFLRELAATAERMIGPMWVLSAEEDVTAATDGPALLRMDSESLRAEFAEAGLHKVLFLSVRLAGAEFSLAAREWDTRLQSLGGGRQRAVYDGRRLPVEAFELLRGVFRPVAVIDDVVEDTVHIRLQAGEFPPPDPTAAQAETGDLLQVAFRYFNRERELQRVQFLPWTYLRVEETERGRARCLLASGLRSPLGGKQRGRIETLALLVRPAPEPTRLKLVKLGRADQPLIAHRVVVSTSPAPNDEEPAEALQLLTDRWGVVEIPADPASPLVWLAVRSGRTLLARLPFVPGIEPRAVLELPDDSSLLNVEGRVALLRGELIDTVARRALLMVQARKSALAGQWEAVDQRIDELKKLPSPRQYQGRLRAVCIPAINEAEARGDRITAGRVRRVLEETNGLIDHYLDRDKLRLLEEEIAELRKVDAEIKNETRRS